MSFFPHVKRSTSRKPTSTEWIPKKYQRACIKFGLKNPAAGFFLAPGLGKTSIVLHIFKILKRLGIVDELFVLASRRIVYGVWRQEIKKWGLELNTTILHGPEKGDSLKDDADVYLMNYEGLQWISNSRSIKPHARKFFKRHPKMMLVIDESSKLRNHGTKRFKSLKRILPKFIRRYILTGSPAPKSLLNLFGQIYVLDFGEALGRFITQYRNEFFTPTGFMGHDWQLQPDGEERISARLRPLVLRFGTDQLDLPPLTFIDRWVKLPSAARELYDEMHEEFIARWKGEELTAANAAVASGKCRQIANGGLWVGVKEPGKPRKYQTIHDEKCADLLELLEELNGEPAFVCYEFKHDRLRAERYFHKQKAGEFCDAPFIAGGVSDREAARIQRSWDRGSVPLLWGHPDSVAHGLNLQGKGGIVIYFSMTWSLENYEQFYQRVHRQGQKRRVLVYRILARKTVDHGMIANLRDKDNNQTRFQKGLENYYGIH